MDVFLNNTEINGIEIEKSNILNPKRPWQGLMFALDPISSL